MDSVGRVQVLHLDVDASDSVVHCFILSEPQRRRELNLAQEVVRLDSIGTAGIRVEPMDGAIAKVVIYRRGKPLFSYRNHPVPEYADSTATAFHLAQVLHESHRKPSPCTGVFSAPVLTQGLDV